MFLISENALQGQATYVHCKAGRGRSTTVVICYLVSPKVDSNFLFSIKYSNSFFLINFFPGSTQTDDPRCRICLCQVNPAKSTSRICSVAGSVLREL